MKNNMFPNLPLKKDDIDKLIEKYFLAEGYEFPNFFEHRYDKDSSAITYSLVRHFKPKTILHIGTWEGGSVCLIMSALLRNREPFVYIASELLNDKRSVTAQHCLERNGAIPMMIEDITQNLHLIPNSIDFLFHDTDHDIKTTEWVFQNIIPRLQDGALVNFHDWPVIDENGVWKSKQDLFNEKVWLETEYMLELHKTGKLPFEKLYFNYEEGHGREAGFFIYRKPKL